MMDSTIPTIAHLIQLSVAPVFLLTGIGSVLAVMTSRLSRIVDRTRILESLLLEHEEADAENLRNELRVLFKRAVLSSRAITLCTVTALLICAVIILLFVGDIASINVKLPVVLLFVLGMTTFFLGLLNFLREIMLATASIEESAQRALTKRRIITLKNTP